MTAQSAAALAVPSPAPARTGDTATDVVVGVEEAQESGVLAITSPKGGVIRVRFARIIGTSLPSFGREIIGRSARNRHRQNGPHNLLTRLVDAARSRTDRRCRIGRDEMAFLYAERETETPLVCVYCGGNAGISERMPHHNLCRALAERNMPTPRLDNCPGCGGTGLDNARAMKAGQSVIDPNGAQLARLFPTCPSCLGSRTIRRPR